MGTKRKHRGRGNKKGSSAAGEVAPGASSRAAKPSSTATKAAVSDDRWKSPLSDEARERRKPRSIFQVISMAFDFSVEEEWTRVTFPELPTFIFWMRQLVAISAAVACGIAPVVGLPAILIWAILDLGGVWFYLHRLTMVQIAQGDDDEAAGENGSSDYESFKLQSLMMEGLGPSVANFLFFWTLFYNLLHVPAKGSGPSTIQEGETEGDAEEDGEDGDFEEGEEYGEDEYGEEDVAAGADEL